MLCAVIADDLTGACDSAVQFAGAGLRTVAVLSGDGEEADVVAFSTDSRDVAPAEAVRRLRALAPCIRADLVFKKIDSTLRGNTCIEIAAALDAFGLDTALVNPAFPEMGRIVEDGWLRLTNDAAFSAIHIRARLPDERCICFDARHQEELAARVRETLDGGRRVLWAGSAGMASALAASVARGAPGGLPPDGDGPVLFCIGSDHPVTLEQQRRVLEARGHREVVLRVERGCAPDLSGFRPSALFLCGGDTAALVCRSLGTRSIELRRELARGIPAGILRGGSLDGTPVVTKSGGFGAPDDLIHIADYFHA